MNTVIVRHIRLPRSVRAVTVTDPQGDYNVYVNEALPDELQKSAWEHEMRHIRLGHFYGEKGLLECEIEADKKS